MKPGDQNALTNCKFIRRKD